MATTSNAEYFFQTSSSIEDNDRKKRKASNTLGSPVKFPSKLLAVEVHSSLDPTGDTVLVAEAGGTVSSLKLSTNEVTGTGRGVQAPVTCLTSYGIAPTGAESSAAFHIFSGSWDKTVTRYSYETPSKVAASGGSVEQARFKAHADFVKCLLVVPTPDKQVVLVSGGADGELNIWTIDGQRLATVKPQCRGIECLVLDSFSSPDAPTIFFSTSQREIFHFVLPPLGDIKSSTIQLSEPLLRHETSVYKLFFDSDGDLWTASADKSAKRLVRESGFGADTVLTHPDFVRDVVVHSQYGLAITACRDEEIRVWNTGSGQLVHVFAGHYEEVTGLALAGDILLSISIDGTLRRWSLAPSELKRVMEEAANPNLSAQEPEPSSNLGMLTAEEEAELAALMEQEEEESLERMAVDDQ